MQVTLGTPQTGVRDAIETQNILKPMQMPEASGKDKPVLYIVKIKEDAPFMSETILGQEITKYRVAKECALAANIGKPPKQTVQTFLWAKNQKDAFIKRAKEIQKTVVNREKQEREHLILFDYLDIMTEDEFYDSMRPQKPGNEVIAP